MLRVCICPVCGEVVEDELGRPIHYDSVDPRILCGPCEQWQQERNSGRSVPVDLDFMCPPGSSRKH
jgi:hypothetical protein